MTTSHNSRLDPLLEPLQIPPDFSRYEKLVESEIIASLEQWKQKTDLCLSELRDLAAREGPQFSVRDQAQFISTTASFEGQGPWTTDFSREISKEILAPFADPPVELLDTILTHHVKPIFKFNPHPSLNLSTGRKLPENAGGPMGSQDYYEGQVWKRHSGAPNLLSWCVRNIQSVAYEGLWHLVIPSVMTLLDDYEAPYKLRGIRIVSEMLERVPVGLLRRTGVDGLLFSSLSISLTNLHNPLTPSIIRTVIPTTLALINLSTPPGSQLRFDKLCALLGDGIVGNVWIYASMELESIQATLEVLPDVIEMLGIGLVKPSRDMQLLSLRALGVLVDECTPRIPRWKGTILDAVSKCWVGIVDLGVDDPYSRKLKGALRDVCAKLVTACPSVVQEEYRGLLSLDASMFGELLLRHDETVNSG